MIETGDRLSQLRQQLQTASYAYYILRLLGLIRISWVKCYL